MNRKRCQETGSKLHALRAGELNHLERTAVEAHLASCQSCSAELWLQAELENAAKCGPHPFSDAKKRELFAGVQRQLFDQPGRVARAATFSWPRLRFPALATAAAAILAVLGLVSLDRSIEAPRATKAGWVAHESDVQVFAATPVTASFTREAEHPLLRVEEGTLLVRFERRPESAPLEVQTPDLEIIVRGTVLSVAVSRGKTVVCVQHGKVEVKGGAGEVIFLGDGERGELRSGHLTRDTATIEQRRQMATVFGKAPPTTPTPPEPAPALPQVQQGPTLAKAIEAEPAQPGEPPPDLVEVARGTWRHGDPEGALAQLWALLDAPDLTSRGRQEALYLAATIQRELGHHREAAASFTKLVQSDAATPVVRLARLERARLLAQHLDEKQNALDELDVLMSDGATDAVADAATFERCALLIEQHELTPALTCLDEYLARFENGSHAGECAILRDRLLAAASKGARP